VYRFKLGTIGEKAPEDWIVVENCHEPIVDKATFLLVQERLKSRKRSTRQGEPSLFAGLLKCGECGKSLCLTYENSKEHPKVYCCKTYNLYGAHHCTRHKVRYDELTSIVLEQIHTLGAAALRDREAVLRALKAQTGNEYAQRRGALQKRIRDAEERMEVLERLVTRLYDDLTSGRISEENFFSVMNRTQEEQKALRDKVAGYHSELDRMEQPESDDDEWVSLIAQYADIQELDAELLNRLVKKIVVYEQDGSRKLEIYFNAKSLPELHNVG
jgi:DNA polymerase III delta prime subunit